jgi:hypothetical protein
MRSFTSAADVAGVDMVRAAMHSTVAIQVRKILRRKLVAGKFTNVFVDVVGVYRVMPARRSSI